MGHALNIHNKIYQQRPVLKDILEIGKVLNNVSKKARGLKVTENNSREHHVDFARASEDNDEANVSGVTVARKITDERGSVSKGKELF